MKSFGLCLLISGMWLINACAPPMARGRLETDSTTPESCRDVFAPSSDRVGTQAQKVGKACVDFLVWQQLGTDLKPSYMIDTSTVRALSSLTGTDRFFAVFAPDNDVERAFDTAFALSGEDLCKNNSPSSLISSPIDYAGKLSYYMSDMSPSPDYASEYAVSSSGTFVFTIPSQSSFQSALLFKASKLCSADCASYSGTSVTLKSGGTGGLQSDCYAVIPQLPPVPSLVVPD